MICKSHTHPRPLCTSTCLALVAVAQRLRDELTQKMFPPPSSSPQPNQIAWQIWILGEDQSLGAGLAVLYAVYTYVCIFMALLTPDHLIRLNFVFITFLKYHLRNLSFLGYSQCLFLGQRRPTLRVAMPHHLFSCCITGVPIPAVAASFHRADGFLWLCLCVQPDCPARGTAQPEQGANTLLSNLAISFQQQQLNVTPPGPGQAETL